MVKLIEINNRKNKVLRGVLTLPDNIENPIVVLNLHGFAGDKSGYKYAHTHLSRVLEANGFGCARFDFYGCGESDGEFEEMTFTGLIEDAIDMYNWLIDSKITTSDRIILSGHSMGGYVASCVAPKLKPTGLILMCPGGGMWYGCRERADELKNKSIQYANMEGLKFNIDFNYDLYNYEPFSNAKGYDNDVIIIRGTEDKLVNDQICKTYLECYNSKKAKYVEIETGDHNFANIKAKSDCEDAIINFCKLINNK
ncbi:alpha/beta hydrolase [Clostridium perfringens]|uniref:alpha/beta hydrolase n=1 Tax=Clostridium perfringens TaxID=1502 RepID=UPI000667414B|nr:alpha/beta fold hydrolase [Clostridium perfringens]STB12713.1 prolyl oligopeptidase family protein [Clostridium novyi]MBX9098992.1 alpha/beta hydrolase [Clostridium perfringens]MCX0357253.1 lysophospholipase [Clostridium perfringens]MCX0407678.1 lysophospholipase [Clostridium perfringens]MCX0419375.1 lysophospholipase [Clostridium perfringens]